MKDDDLPLPSDDQGKAFLVGMVARRKSGKTFFLDQMMKTVWKGEFDKIYILSETARYQEYFKTWEGDIDFLESWERDFFTKLKEKQVDEPKRKVLIVVDDMSDSMRNTLYESNIDKFAFVGRHFRVSVVWLAQKITLFTPGFRQECDAFFLFREENMQELRLLHREWGFGEMDDFLILLLEHTDVQFSWVMIRNIGGRIRVFRLPTPEECQHFLPHSKSGHEAPKSGPSKRARIS